MAATLLRISAWAGAGRSKGSYPSWMPGRAEVPVVQAIHRLRDAGIVGQGAQGRRVARPPRPLERLEDMGDEHLRVQELIVATALLVQRVVVVARADRLVVRVGHPAPLRVDTWGISACGRMSKGMAPEGKRNKDFKRPFSLRDRVLVGS